MLSFQLMVLLADGSQPIVLYIGFTGALTALIDVFLLAMTSLGKMVRQESAGTLFGAFSLIGSLGVLFINKLGGYLYSEADPIWPFIIVFISYTILISIIGIFAVSKRLHV